MTNYTYAAFLHADRPSLAQVPSAAGFFRTAMRRFWGGLCGVTFLATRASGYLVLIPLTLLACLAGVALYAVHAILGGQRA